MRKHLPELDPIPHSRGKYSFRQPFNPHDNPVILKKFGYENPELTTKYVGIKGNVFVRDSLDNPSASLISYYKHGTGMGHMSVMINRGGELDYYDPEGNPIQEDIRNVFAGKKIVEHGTRHQYEPETCTRHSLTRACLSHMDRASYDATIRNAMAKYGLSADAIVRGITSKTLEVEPVVMAEPKQSLKFGGIVYGRR